MGGALSQDLWLDPGYLGVYKLALFLEGHFLGLLVGKVISRGSCGLSSI